MSLAWSSLFLVLAGAWLCAADLRIYDSQKIIACSQGLTECRVDNKNFVVPPSDFGPVEVLSFTLEPALCLTAAKAYKACLLIKIQLQILSNDVSGETSEESENEAHAAVTLCYASVPNLHSCKRIKFIVKFDSENNQEVMEVVVYDGVFLGSSVNVTINKMSLEVDFPQHNTVCPEFPDLEECKIPKFVAKFDLSRGVVELRGETEELLQMCMRRKGMGQCWPSERTIPLHAVTHCMCFQAWRQNTEDKKSSRSINCPFENNTEIRKNAAKNVSFSVRHSETNEGHPALSWNVSAPCRLEAEVWPCQRAVYLGGGCSEVRGFRRHVSTGWEENITMVWTSGTFWDVRTTNGLEPCVMFKIDGEIFGPVCERDVHRGRWICGVFVTLLVFILLAVGVFVFRSRFKEWLSESIPVHQSSGLRGKVLLVHSSISDTSFRDAVCRVATWLSDLGFAVSLDLWDQERVSDLGPTPWLHSRLQHVQQHGGKTLLLLSREAVLQARAYYESCSGAMNREDDKANNIPPPWTSDVFSSALNSLFSAQLRGADARHFALVQLDSEELDLSELFQGLRLYRLPSESRCLLADLHFGCPGSLGARLKRFLWSWRASLKLEERLRRRETEQKQETLPLNI
ncbi:uncharacterized protein il17rc [Clarias gariepinus]|uniref:uncharacterized protein il17rc n=1 Tax=Clarias gariepinus TaxID=13013 RepID=UPI00234D8B20|nr:uncharacterized protein il17rc [Clarias gariepinus]